MHWERLHITLQKINPVHLLLSSGPQLNIIFNSLITHLVNMWRWWTGPVALCLAETLCIVCSSPPKMPKRWVEQRGVGPFSRGHWHIFPPRGETRVEKLNASSNSIHFLKNSVYYMFVVCDFIFIFFWRYQCFTIWTVYNNAISIWLLFFFLF